MYKTNVLNKSRVCNANNNNSLSVLWPLCSVCTLLWCKFQTITLKTVGWVAETWTVIYRVMDRWPHGPITEGKTICPPPLCGGGIKKLLLGAAQHEQENVTCHDLKRFRLFLFWALYRLSAWLLWKYIKLCISDNIEQYCCLWSWYLNACKLSKFKQYWPVIRYVNIVMLIIKQPVCLEITIWNSLTMFTENTEINAQQIP